MPDNKLELVVEVDVNKANASIKSINTGLSSMEQAAGKAARGASAGIDGLTISMVKGSAAGNLLADSIKKALDWAKEWTLGAAQHAAHTDKMSLSMAALAKAYGVSAEASNLAVEAVKKVGFGTQDASYTRFGIGGPADLFAETRDEQAFLAAVAAARETRTPVSVIGGGTNLIVSDQGFRGLVLRYSEDTLQADGRRITAGAGAALQDLVDFANHRGLQGLETLAGIPGWVGAAVYGNAGAYGHSIAERVAAVRFFDGARVRMLVNRQCEFRYRESIFKRHKEWIIFQVELMGDAASAVELERVPADILKVRNEKFPPTMKCAGSIFKNFLLRELPLAVAAEVPAAVVRDGKIPAAWFLEQVGAKGMQLGDIHEIGRAH